jgi:hypothetical protein
MRNVFILASLEGTFDVGCEDVVGRGSEQYLLGGLSTIA